MSCMWYGFKSLCKGMSAPTHPIISKYEPNNKHIMNSTNFFKWLFGIFDKVFHYAKDHTWYRVFVAGVMFFVGGFTAAGVIPPTHPLIRVCSLIAGVWLVLKALSMFGVNSFLRKNNA